MGGEGPQHLDEPVERVSRLEWARRRAAAVREQRDLLVERSQRERQRHATLDAVFEIADRDIEVGGGIMAGALAYRLFIWLLPLALVVVAGLGIAADAADRSPTGAASEVGLAGLVSSSVATAARSSARWYALLIGIPALVYATRGVLRALIVSHRLVWLDVRSESSRPTLTASLRLLGVLLGMVIVSADAAGLRSSSALAGLGASLVVIVPDALLWLYVSTQLPHRTAGWRDLIPGALCFGVGLETLHIVAIYVIAPLADSKQGTYGSLGLAAALLLDLYLLSRVAIGAAVVNATLWERRQRGSRAASPA